LANGDPAHAKEMFQKVVKQYPHTEAAKQAAKQLASMQ
jgi:TolA-binding protein